MSATLSSLIASTASAVTSAASATATGNRATPQGGILEGVIPTVWDPKNPITVFIIQAGIIIIFCRLLQWPLSLIGQPRVIAEVIGGILLGPSVLSRIPGFRAAIFPDSSMPVLNNVANLGLILFLFLIALEVDIRLFTSNWRIALSVGLAGMILPFAMGFGIAYGLYHQFSTDAGIVAINFGTYGLFIGTALAITAFPVLCRILVELNLLNSTVGVTTLAAGVGNDVVGWILLALCVALANNSSGLTALYVLLACVGWILVLVFAVRPAFLWLLRRNNSIQNGPTQEMVAVTLLLVLISAWFTNIIGVHAIFGGFLVGLICPHDGGFAIKLTEKIEDLIAVIFLPLYFALSGLNTDLGLLNDGITWAYVIGVIAIAFTGKIVGGTLAARATKCVWRESLTIGVLMSCKGLVELIVLNIGLQAKILSTRTFTMFVVMALVTTFATSPLVKLLYPPWYQKKLESWKRGEIDWDGNALKSPASSSVEKLQNTRVRRLLVYLRLDSLPSLFTFISLLGEEVEVAKQEAHSPEHSDGHDVPVVIKPRPLEVHGLRILQLGDRTSSVMQVSETEEYTRRDPVVNAFKTFAQLHDVAVSGNVAVSTETGYAKTVVSQALDQESDFALIPWSEVGSLADDQSVPSSVSTSDRFSGKSQQDFIQEALRTAVCTTGIFISNGFGGIPFGNQRPNIHRTASGLSLRSAREPAIAPVADKSHHIFFPFVGGADDGVALRFVLQLARSPHVTVTIAHLNLTSEVDEVSHVTGAPSSSDPAKDAVNTEVTAQDAALLSTLQASLAPELANRVFFTEVTVSSSGVAAKALDLAKEKVGKARNAGDIIVVGRRHPNLKPSAGSPVENGLRNTVGVLGEKISLGNLKASVLVIQAKAEEIAENS